MIFFKPLTSFFFIVALILLPYSIIGAELTPLSTIADAFKNQQSNLQVTQEGVISRVLSDDTIGDRHQRIIIRLTNNQTLLIAHNVDIAPRVPNPSVGKVLRFCGEYEWNDEGGVIHWTHTDPGNQHVAGWLEYEGKRYSDNSTKNISIFRGTPGVINNISTESAKHAFDFSLNAKKPRFDLHGRLTKRAYHKQTTGIYLTKSIDNKHISIGR